jgi:hypothetical protein
MNLKIRFAILRSEWQLSSCVAILFGNALKEVKIRVGMDLFYRVV